MTQALTVTVSIVTYNAARFIEPCVASLKAQDYPYITIYAVDNASTDGSGGELLRHLGPERVFLQDVNNGYAGGHNRVAAATNSDYLFFLNPDVVLEPDYITKAVAAAQRDTRIGGVAGRVYRVGENAVVGDGPPPQDCYDTTGIYPRALGMYVDRGQGERPTGQNWEREQHQVFGISGCAAFYRRSALIDVSPDNEVFDSDLFAYFDDVDLAWRLQLRGWRLIFEPSLAAYHVRSHPGITGRPSNPWVNTLVTRNRWLVTIKDVPVPALLWKIAPMLARDITQLPRLGAMRGSTHQGYREAVALLPRMLHKRRVVMRTRTEPRLRLMRWFLPSAVSGRFK